jgi:endonuclease YncB( thermonuclease family)
MYRRVRSLRRRVMVIAAVLAVMLLYRVGPHLLRPTLPETLAEGSYSVDRVIDGGTLLLTNGARVCMIGVNVDPADDKAVAYIESLLATKRDDADARPAARPLDKGSLATVRLEFDRERLDRQERFWAYVWVGDSLLNEEVLRAGLGRVDLQSRYNQSKKTRFRKAEQEAKSGSRGRWAAP